MYNVNKAKFMVLISWLKNRLSQPTIEDIASPLPTSEMRKRTKIVVVDDEKASFPTKGLQDNGYTVEWWDKVNAANLRRLENGEFDIIILDIQGIAEKSLSDTGNGLGILRRIKNVNPDQIVVAFSGQTYDLDSISFFKSADESMRKPVTLTQCMEVLDRLISEHVSVRAYWDNLQRLLEKSGVPTGKIKSLELTVVKSAKTGKRLSFEEIQRIVGNIDSLLTVVGWVTKIVSLCNVS